MNKLTFWITLGIVAVTITLLPVYLSSRAAPAAQYTPPPPRPTMTPRPTNTPPGSPPPPRPTPVPSSVPPRPTPLPPEPPSRPTPSLDEGDSPTAAFRLHGQVWKWEQEPVGQIAVRLQGQDWSVQTTTDMAGQYAFDGLGQGIALLNLVLSEGFLPLTTDVAVRLGYVSDLTVNLGFYAAGETPAPSPAPVLTADRATTSPGETVVYRIHARYEADASSALSNVLLTDLLPEGMTVISVETSRGSVETWSNLVTVDVGEFVPGEEVTVTLTARVADDLADGMTLTNRATLISNERPATQSAAVTITVGQGSPAVLPETGGTSPD